MNEFDRYGIEPWDEKVNGDEILFEINRHLNSVIILPKGASIAIAIWVVHTYIIEPVGATQLISTSPILSINSPDRQCGKSTVKEILTKLVTRPCPTDNISSASIYRVIELEQPTLLIDEADTFLINRQEMVGILNSGYRPDGFVIRQNGVRFDETTKFSTWGAKAIFSIGNLPASLHSRSISIPMKRKRPEESVTRMGVYMRLHSGELEILKRKILRFCIDNREEISLCCPTLPDDLDDRQQDNWEPLLQIASLCGEEWMQLAIQAAIDLSPKNTLDETNLSEMLLQDIAEIFESEKDDRIPSASLLQLLLSDVTKPWIDYRRGRPITQSDIASLLRRYGIRPVDFRISGRVLKGYLKADFEDSFARYLGKAATPQQSSNETN